MIKRIVVTGAESTGKSTLAKAIACAYQEPLTTEFVRDYVDQLTRPLQQSDMALIAQGQKANEDAKLDLAKELIIHDTNLLSSILYSKLYFDTTLDWVNTLFAERRYSLYLFCYPDIPWVADEGQREGPAERQRIHNAFVNLFAEKDIPFVPIFGDSSQRLQQAVEAIEQLRAPR